MRELKFFLGNDLKGDRHCLLKGRSNNVAKNSFFFSDRAQQRMSAENEIIIAVSPEKTKTGCFIFNGAVRFVMVSRLFLFY